VARNKRLIYPFLLQGNNLEKYLGLSQQLSFHPPVMIITTLVFFNIRRKFLLAGKKH